MNQLMSTREIEAATAFWYRRYTWAEGTIHTYLGVVLKRHDEEHSTITQF